MSIEGKMRQASLAALGGLAVHLAAYYVAGRALLTDAIAEWIMARTPSHWAVPLMETMGEWAKPFAATGGLAILGFSLFVPLWLRRPWLVAAGVAGAALAVRQFGYDDAVGLATFYVPAALGLLWPRAAEKKPGRREALTSLAMGAGTVAVAVEAFVRNRAMAARAVTPTRLYEVKVPAEYESWGEGLVRKALTPLREFYVMSKNTVDPTPDPARWRLKVQFDGRTVREYSYAQLLGYAREERYVSLRCVSNSLKSNLMGTGYWSGIRLEQLVRRGEVPPGAVEMAVIGLDGHGDSFRLDYAFGPDAFFALGMNGETLSRNHGFPIRMLSPRYYGFKSIKWIDRIDFVSQPYFGTWPKMGYTKEPVIHVGAYVDKVKRSEGKLEAGGIAYSGAGEIAEVWLRQLDEEKRPLEEWVKARLEKPLARHTFTRWRHSTAAKGEAKYLEARARDASGRWQAAQEKPLFPDGVSGPTIKTL